MDKLFENLEIVSEINSGEIVMCDLCNTYFDHETNTDVMGGIMFGSYACCPLCTVDILEEHEKNTDELVDIEIFDKNVSFFQNVLDLRYRSHGTKDYITRIYTEKEKI